jgi:hypothetical protein
MRNLTDAGERLFPRMSQHLSNWGVDFRLEALNGSLDDVSCGEFCIRFIREMLEALPEADRDLNSSEDLAMLHFHLHRDGEAEQLCQRLIHDHPDRAVGYVTLSDDLRRHSSNEVPDPVSLQRAIHLLNQTLAYPVS